MTLPPEIQAQRTLLVRLLGPIESIEALPSGTGGRSALVVTGKGQFVAKVFAPDSPVLLGPAEQFELLSELAAGGIAPEPVGFDVDAGLLVTRFVADGQHVSAVDLSEPDSIGQLAALLRELHRVRFDIAPFAPLSYGERYLEAIGGMAALSSRDRQRYDELIELATAPDFDPHCVCHHDLTADNIFLGANPRLIDFDFAVMGAPIVDLASVVVMNDFAEAAASALLAAYFGNQVPFSLAEFARVQRVLRLTAHFWSLASADTGAAIVAQYRIDDV